MWLDEFKKYFGLFILGTALIVVYKTFDNFNNLWSGLMSFISLLTPLFIGAGIAYILYIPCRRLEKLCIKTNIRFVSTHRRAISVASIYIIFIAAVILIIVAIVPSLIRSIKEFMEQLPYLIQRAVMWFNSLNLYTINTSTIQALLSSETFSLDKLLGGFSFDNVNRYAKSFINAGTEIVDIFMTLIISIYLLLDRANIKKSFMRICNTLISDKKRKIVIKYIKRINDFINIYIYCMLIDAVIVFLLSFVALSIMRIKYAPLLALMLGALNMIPYFGAITATILASIITIFTKSLAAGLSVALVLIIIQQIDSNVIQPRLLSESLNIKPVWVIVAIIIGGGLFGVLGILFAVPLFAFIKIICVDIFEFYENKKTEALANTSDKQIE